MARETRQMIDGVIRVASLAAGMIPGGGVIKNGAVIGGKIIDLIDSLKDEATVDQQSEMQAARKKLSEAVKSKAAATSDRLRGK